MFLAFAGLYGAAGVALAAAATHVGGSLLATASQMLLFHAPVLLTLGLWLRPLAGWLFPAGGIVLLLGVALFSGDLSVRHFAEHSLFSMAAPSGGILMIFGWLMLGFAGLFPRTDTH